jgi:Uma2 family endonuclease
MPKTKARGQSVVFVSGASRKSRAPETNVMAMVRSTILQDVHGVEILDPDLTRELVKARQQREVDRYDEVWEGVYVVPPLARNPHQDVATALSGILFNIINLEDRGRVHAGANVSDRRDHWEHNYRCPDVVVVLKGGRAIDCGTHWLGGPDFVVEVESPREKAVRKLPFYSKIQVRELLIVHGETRQLQMYRHDGSQLVNVESSDFKGNKWLKSEVVPLAFRRKVVTKKPHTELQRTDGVSGTWMI